MSKFVLISVILSALFSCTNTRSKRIEENTTKNNDSIRTPIFAINEEIHNFGNLEAGEVVSYIFEIKNEGNSSLIVDSLNTGCGCISVNWTNKVIESGKKEQLEVTFNSAGEWGNVFKPILLYSNDKKKESQIIITAIIKNQLFNN